MAKKKPGRKPAAKPEAPAPATSEAQSSDRQDPTKNKSLAIRMALEGNPNAKPQEVVELVKTQFGHEVTAQLVSVIKSKAKGGASTAKGKPGRKPGSTAAKKPQPSSNGQGKPILEALQFAKSVGGIQQAQDLLATLNGLKTAFVEDIKSL